MDLITTAQAAASLGVSSIRVRQLISAGRLPATKMGTQWLVRRRDLAKVADRKPGRPPKD